MPTISHTVRWPLWRMAGVPFYSADKTRRRRGYLPSWRGDKVTPGDIVSCKVPYIHA